MKTKKLFLLTVFLLMLFVSCNSKDVDTKRVSDVISSQSISSQEDTISSQSEDATPQIAEPYDDIRYFAWRGDKETYEENEYNKDDIITFTFNKETVLKGSEDIQKQIMENGKNPGLGIRAIHERGITGKGVNVAIIDQNLLLNHPEFSGKITSYYDTGCEQDEESGSMHAPAVTSLLAGNSIGVAPDVKVYFAASPSWKGDSEFYAKGLYWIIEENKKLPDDEKIRVVSVSAAPSGNGTPFTDNLHMWDEAALAAQDNGILILDCRENDKTGIIAPAFYDPANPDDVSACKGGFPTSMFKVPSSKIGVPTSYRTVAEEYMEGSPSYQYTGQGGLSWGIPYAAGVLALGWQINPNLDNDQIVQLLFESCSIASDGSNIINPVAFIEAVEKTK